MKFLYATLTLLATCVCCSFAQTTFEVDTIFKNGKLNERINLVFLGDGYQADELEKYRTDVIDILDEIFNQKPFKEYKNYFNAFAINVISNQSGASHPRTSSDNDCNGVPQATVDNYFGSTFDVAGIHRLLAPTKGALLGSVLAEHFPLFDQAFIVVNSLYYGGSGGFYATGSIHQKGKEVAIHEIGHSFGLLADEYWAGPQYATEKPNMTKQANASLVKWKKWLGGEIGIFPHEESPDWKRPHQQCKMRSLDKPFCSVCIEAMIEKIHGLVGPLTAYAPVETTFPIPQTQSIDFTLDLVKPEPNTLKITWNKDYVFYDKNKDMITIPVADMGEGAVIRATVIDTTKLSKSTPHQMNHIYVVEWLVGDATVVGLPIYSSEDEYEISVFPNPVQDHLKISYTLYKPSAVTVSILDVMGRRVKTLVHENQAAGLYEYDFDDIPRSSSEYILEFEFDKATFTRKLIRQ